jgi:hypothetical protein
MLPSFEGGPFRAAMVHPLEVPGTPAPPPFAALENLGTIDLVNLVEIHAYKPAQIVPPSGESLFDIIADENLATNLLLCTDAGDAASYYGGTLLEDRSENKHHFTLGTTASSDIFDPTFEGMIGGLRARDYLLFNGSQLLALESPNPTRIQALHKDGATFSVLMSLLLGSSPALGCGFLGTSGSTGTNVGLRYGHGGADNQVLQVYNGVAPFSFATDGGLTPNAWHILGLSVTENGGAGAGFFFRDGNYDPVGGQDTFNPAYTSPSAGSATFKLQVMTAGGGSLFAPANTRFAALAIWEGTALVKADFDAVFARLRGRFGL